MYNLICIGSSSAGNGYILDCGGEQLIVELGCKWEDYLKALNYEMSGVVGATLTHFHQDHANNRTATKAINSGIPVYSCKEVYDKFGEVRLIETKKKYKIGSFLVQAISVNHSCECYAYIIEHESFGKLLFATDLTDFPYRIKGLSHILLETNNDEDVMIDNYIEGNFSRSASDTHLSLQKAISVLKANYSADLRTVVAIHLSDANSNAKQFKQRIQDELGFANVYIAERGLSIELKKKEDF